MCVLLQKARGSNLGNDVLRRITSITMRFAFMGPSSITISGKSILTFSEFWLAVIALCTGPRNLKETGAADLTKFLLDSMAQSAEQISMDSLLVRI